MSKMGRLKEALLVVLVVGLLTSKCVGQPDWSCEKEKACNCLWVSGKRTADCKAANLTEIPRTLSKEAQQLDLTSNTISHLAPNVFYNRQLENLQKLVLRECGIKNVDQQAFTGLKIVIEIDLSFNRIKQLHRGTFDGTIRLRVIHLNNNHLTKLEDGLFHDLGFLQKVELSNNHLSHIGQSAFVNLRQLHHLYLNDNKLTTLDTQTFGRIQKLSSLELRKNPWHCDCRLKSFRDWAIASRLYTKPTACDTPRELQGQEWDEVPEDRFACRPEIQSIGAAQHGDAGVGSAQLWCRASAEPPAEIAWTLRSRTLTNGTKRQHASGTTSGEAKTYVLLRSAEWANLTIPEVSLADRGEYVCVAKNFGGSVEQNYSLNVVGEGPNRRDSMVGLPLAIGLGLIAFIFLVMALTLCLCYCRRRRSHHDEKSAEAASLDHHGLGEQEKSLITAINPVVKPPRRYEAPSLTSHGTEMTELNRTLLDNDSVFADGVGSVVGVLSNGLHEEERLGRATPELDSMLGGVSGSIAAREGSISGMGNTSIGMIPGLSPMTHGGSIISGLGTLSRNTTPYRQYPPDLLAFSGGRNSSPTSQASTAPDSSRLPMQIYGSPSSPVPSVLAVATYAPVGFKTLPHPVRAASATPYSMGHHHPTLSRLAYGTIPRRPRAPSWSSGPPTSPTDRDILEPVYDNLGVRRTADGSSKRSLNKSPEPVYSMRGRPLPSTPTTPSSMHQFTLPRAPRSSPIVRQLNRSAPENATDWPLSDKRLQQRQLQQQLLQQERQHQEQLRQQQQQEQVSHQQRQLQQQLLEQQERQQHELRQQKMQQEQMQQQLYEEQQQKHRQQQKEQKQLQEQQELQQKQQEQQLQQESQQQEQNHVQDTPTEEDQPKDEQQVAPERVEQNEVPEQAREQQDHESKSQEQPAKEQNPEQRLGADEAQLTTKISNGPISNAKKVPPRPPPKPKNKSANGPTFEDEGEDGTEV